MSWKNKVLEDTSRMTQMKVAHDRGKGYSRLEEEFNIPSRHGMNARDLLLRWTNKPKLDAPGTSAGRGISVMPELPKKIVIPEGEEPKKFVAFFRAMALGMKPEDLSGGQIEDLWQDALRRDLVDGYTYPKMTEPEKQWIETLREARNENAKLCNKVRAIQRSTPGYRSFRNGMLATTGTTDILSEKDLQSLTKNRKWKQRIFKKKGNQNAAE